MTPRICIATSDYYKQGETFVNRHIEHLFGGAVGVVCGRYPIPHPALDTPVHVRRATIPPIEMPVAFVQAIYDFLANGSYRYPNGRRRSDLVSFLQAIRCDAILSEFGTQVIPLAKVARELKIPLFTYLRGYDASSTLRNWIGRREYRAVLPQLSGLFSVSQFLINNLHAHGINTPAETHVIPSGVDIQSFPRRPKIPSTCITVGRLVEKKAPVLTIAAFLRATEGNGEARLLVVGDGPLMSACTAHLKLHDPMGKVRLCGGLPHSRVKELLSASEVYLQHSITSSEGSTEGLPTALQEAMAAGCAIVASSHAGIPEAIKHLETGLLCPEEDLECYVAAIRRVLTDEVLRSRLMTEARLVAQTRFDNKKGLEILENTLQHILGTRRLT